MTEPNANKHVNRFTVFSVVFFVFSIMILVLSRLSVWFSEAYCSSVSAFLRSTLGFITHFLPFSVAETTVIITPIAMIVLFVFAVIRRLALHEKGAIFQYFKKTFCLALLLASLFIHIFGVCYSRIPLKEHFELDTDSVTQHDIFISTAILLEAAGLDTDEILYDASGSSVKPYDFKQLSENAENGYRAIYRVMPPVLSIKPVALSEPWTYTHISGMYMPFTGESNINVNYPDYIVAFTTCHEAAHQLGIASEDEANFAAFLACMFSDDIYLHYAGCMNAAEYLLSDLDAASARALLGAADRRISAEFAAYSRFFDQYRVSTAAKISSVVNDGYLKSQGVSNGVQSYSEVTKLVAAYLKVAMPEYFDAILP